MFSNNETFEDLKTATGFFFSWCSQLTLFTRGKKQHFAYWLFVHINLNIFLGTSIYLPFSNERSFHAPIRPLSPKKIYTSTNLLPLLSFPFSLFHKKSQFFLLIPQSISHRGCFNRNFQYDQIYIQDLVDRYIFQPVAVETTGVLGPSTQQF